MGILKLLGISRKKKSRRLGDRTRELVVKELKDKYKKEAREATRELLKTFDEVQLAS